MDGPVLSGGVIVVVAVLLWVLYFVPSWRGRHQYYAAERNAVRLNQALRVLAETSETPDEVRLELTARTALAQQRLAKRVQAEKESAQLERLREELAATRRDPVLRQARARRRVRLTATAVLVLALGMLGFGAWQAIVTGGWMLAAAGLVLAALASPFWCAWPRFRVAVGDARLVPSRSPSPSASPRRFTIRVRLSGLLARCRSSW